MLEILNMGSFLDMFLVIYTKTDDITLRLYRRTEFDFLKRDTLCIIGYLKPAKLFGRHFRDKFIHVTDIDTHIFQPAQHARFVHTADTLCAVFFYNIQFHFSLR